MTYLPPSTAKTAATLSDTDTVLITQGGVAKAATLATLKSYVGSASSAATGSTGATSGSTGATSAPVLTESAEGTSVTTVGPTIVDAAKNVYSISSDAYVVTNGVKETTISANVVQIYYHAPTSGGARQLYQKSSAGNWYTRIGATAAYTGPAADPTATGSTGATAATGTATPPASTSASPGITTPVRGVSLSGMEFGSNVPGSVGAEYLVGQEQQIPYWTGKGAKIFRLPFLWERVQTTMGGPLDGAGLPGIDAVVTAAVNAGCFVILDMHQYMRYTISGTQYIIGETSQATAANFADVWSKLASRYKNQPKVIFDLMNEPHDVNLTTLVSTYNTAIAAIRATGATNMLMLEGTAYTGAQSWVSSGNGAAMLKISDSANNYVFEVHQYLDSDGSGINTTCVVGAGSTRMQPFTDWARTNGKKGFLGETDFADNAQCYTEGRAQFDHIKNNADVYLGWTYWSAGFWPNDNPLTVQPNDINHPVDKPQVATLVSYFP